MLLKRYWGLALIGVLIGVLSVSAVRGTVQADPLLQDVPRLDGMNIYFTEAGGEASRFDRTDAGLSRFAGLLSQLGANLFTLEWRTGFPTDADLIVIAGPVTDFAPDQIARLWSYMNNNGRVLLLANPIGETAKQAAFSSRTGLFSLMWADMGLNVRNDVVAMKSTAPIYATPTPEATDAVENPEATEAPLPVVGERDILVTTFTTSQYSPTHPIMQGLDGDLAFFTARSLELDASIQGFTLTPLVFTTDQFYGESAYAQYLKDGTFSFNIGSDTTQGALPLAAALEDDRKKSRIVLIGDREFATNGGGLRTSPSNSAGFVYPNNARFLLNAATWLLEKAPVQVDFPSPAPTATVTITPSPTPSPTAAATLQPTASS